MAKKKSKRPVWFKIFLSQKAVIDAVPDDIAGRALKAALHYFATSQIPDLGPLEMVVFAAMRQSVDESFEDFRKAVEAGYSGSDKRWGDGKNSPPIPTPTTPMGVRTEEEGEGEEEGEEDKREREDIKSAPTRFSPPSVSEVQKYCEENELHHIDAQKFVDHYTANGWVRGNAPIKDWKAVARIWDKEDSTVQSGSKVKSIPDIPGVETL